MSAHSRQRLFGKVMVPPEVHRQVWALGLSYPKLATTLGIALSTVDEFAHPGGSVMQSTLDRVRTRLAEIAEKAVLCRMQGGGVMSTVPRSQFIGRSASFRISESTLSVRAKNALQQLADKVYPRYDWISWSHLTRQGLLRLRHCGAKTANEILRYGVQHASPKQAERFESILELKRCPTCGKLP